MRILIIHNRYSHPGGEEKVVEMQKRLLTDAADEVQTYIRDYHEMDGWLFGRLQSFFSALYSRKSINDIREIIDRFHPDVAIIHNLFPIISAAVIKQLKRAGIPIVMTVHNYRLFCPIGLFFNKGNVCTKCAETKQREFSCLANKCQGTFAGSLAFSIRGWWSRRMGYFDFIDMFLSVSEFQKKSLIRYGLREEKISILPNCVHKGKITEKEDYIGFAGRLSSEKGIDLLFDIASALPDIKFKVAGDKASGFTLPKAPKNIEIMGYLTGEDLQNFYSKAKAIIFTSKVWEAMPLAVLEAMTSGTVVIANQVSSIPEILDNGNAGIIFNSARDCVSKVKYLMENPSLQIDLEKKGMERVKDYYSEARYITSLRKVLNQTISKKNKFH